MFISASTLLLPVVALSSFVAAAPGAIAARGNSCSSGVLQCCLDKYEVRPSATIRLTMLLSLTNPHFPFVGHHTECPKFWHFGSRCRPLHRHPMHDAYRRWPCIWCQLQSASRLLHANWIGAFSMTSRAWSISHPVYDIGRWRCQHGLQPD